MAYESAGNDRGAGEATWIMHQQMQPNPKTPWPSNYNSENNHWSGAMESAPYPGYPPNYWCPQSHCAAPYGNAYPPGTEVNGHPPYSSQPVGGYPNGVYGGGGQYPAGMMPHTNPFYCSDRMHPRAQYHPSGGPDRPPGATNPPPYPGPPCSGAHGYAPGSYPHYVEGGAPMPSNPAYPSQPPRPRAESWAPNGGYGPTPPQQWPAGTQTPHGHHGNHVRPPQPPPWRGPAPPPYEHKDQSYHSAPLPPPAHQSSRPRPPSAAPGPAPSAPPNPVEFSAGPQLYPRAAAPPAGPEHPGLARVQEVLGRVRLLQEDVDGFVGRKTDRAFRCLEELLTKALLELDSVQTDGQDGVRQARKDAVRRVQAVLEQLERKAF